MAVNAYVRYIVVGVVVGTPSTARTLAEARSCSPDAAVRQSRCLQYTCLKMGAAHHHALLGRTPQGSGGEAEDA